MTFPKKKEFFLFFFGFFVTFFSVQGHPYSIKKLVFYKLVFVSIRVFALKLVTRSIRETGNSFFSPISRSLTSFRIRKTPKLVRNGLTSNIYEKSRPKTSEKPLGNPEPFRNLSRFSEVFFICLVLRLPWRVVFGSGFAKTGLLLLTSEPVCALAFRSIQMGANIEHVRKRSTENLKIKTSEKPLGNLEPFKNLPQNVSFTFLKCEDFKSFQKPPKTSRGS